MTEFDSKTDITKERGICTRIKNDKKAREKIISMVDETMDTEKEIAVGIAEHNGEVFIGKTVTGSEKSIAGEAIREIKFDTTEFDFQFNVNDDRIHLVHTHPSTFADLSIGDIMAHLEDINAPLHFTSSLVAAENPPKDGIIINGIELVDMPTDEEMNDIESVVNVVDTMVDGGEITRAQGKRRLWQEMEEFYTDCSALIER